MMEETKDELAHMFDMQFKMQKANAAKRITILDPDQGFVEEKIQAAMFYWNCTVVEWAELQAEIEKEVLGQDVTAKIHEEYIDMLHFVLCQLIYLDYRTPLFELNQIYEIITKTEDLFNKMSGGMDFTKNEKGDLALKFWVNLCKSWGNILNSFPYKNWKTYENPSLEKTDAQYEMIQVFLCEFFSMGWALGMSKNDIYMGYINKNKINGERQLPGGRYAN